MHLSDQQRKAYDVHHAGYMGRVLAGKKHIVKGVYSFATLGGAVSSINLKDVYGEEIVIPNGAIVTQVLLDITTAIVSTSNDGTIALALNTANDLLSAVDGDSLSTGIKAGVPVNTAATAVKATADRKLVLGIATHALTAGVFDVYVEYMYVPAVA
jgi:hypothetical protein